MSQAREVSITVKIRGLRTAIYPAPDLSAAKNWYSKVLGLEPYFDQPFYVGFTVGGSELGLVPDATPGTAGPQPLWVAWRMLASELKRLIEVSAVLTISIPP